MLNRWLRLGKMNTSLFMVNDSIHSEWSASLYFLNCCLDMAVTSILLQVDTTAYHARTPRPLPFQHLRTNKHRHSCRKLPRAECEWLQEVHATATSMLHCSAQDRARAYQVLAHHGCKDGQDRPVGQNHEPCICTHSN